MASIVSAGTTSATALNMSADTSGVLQLASNNGTVAVTVDAAQNVGIGTSSPSAKLDVQGSNAYARVKSTGGTYALLDVDSPSASQPILRFLSNGVEQARILSPVNEGASQLVFTTGTSATERARIDSSGNLLVGTTSAINGSTNRVQILNVNTGAGGLTIGNTTGSGATTAINFVNSNGFVGAINTAGTTTSYNTSSDYRLKENIQPMTGALAKVAALKPVTYTWKADGSAGEGFIAHELAEVCPHAVTGEKDAVDAEGKPVYQGIDVSFLVGTLTAALQEAHGLIKNLETRLAALEGAK